MVTDAGIELLILVVFNKGAASVQDARVLFLLLGHFPPEVSQLRLGEKQVRETKVNLRNQPFNLSKSNQRIERLLGAHASFKCSLRNFPLFHFSLLGHWSRAHVSLTVVGL